jgi:hypothetical protein
LAYRFGNGRSIAAAFGSIPSVIGQRVRSPIVSWPFVHRRIRVPERQFDLREIDGRHGADQTLLRPR